MCMYEIVVQVDHSTRGIVVGGKPFGLGSGWYMDGNEEKEWMCVLIFDDLRRLSFD